MNLGLVVHGKSMLSHLLLFASIAFSVFAQLTMKSRAIVHASTSNSAVGYLQYLIGMATDWRVLCAAGATFVAGVGWLCALQRLDLGYAFPFMAFSFILTPVAATLFFGEPLALVQIVGLILVFAGLTLSALAR